MHAVFDFIIYLVNHQLNIISGDVKQQSINQSITPLSDRLNLRLYRHVALDLNGVCINIMPYFNPAETRSSAWLISALWRKRQIIKSEGGGGVRYEDMIRISLFVYYPLLLEKDIALHLNNFVFPLSRAFYA